MSRKALKAVCFTVMVQIFILLGGCNVDGGDGGPANLTVQPSVTEGFAALDVTFNVIESNIVLVGADWDFGDGTTFKPDSASDSVSHTFSEPGQYTVSASFRESSSLSPTVFEIPITVLPDVNLVVASFAIDADVTPGGLETVSAIIQNVGTSSLVGSGRIQVGYYLSTDSTITVDDIYIGDTSIELGDSFSRSDVEFGFELLAPGENYQYDHQLAVKGNIPDGSYYAGAIVDYIDYYDWYTFPRATDTEEYQFRTFVVVDESDEADNARVLPAYQVDVSNTVCVDDAYEDDDDSASANLITVGETQLHNFCFDNADWLQFDAVQGSVYKISTSALAAETDTQLVLYDRDAESILLFHDNLGNADTVDLLSGFPPDPSSEIVWEAQVSGRYFVKVRTTACDEDINPYCSASPDGVGLDTGYSITLD